MRTKSLLYISILISFSLIVGSFFRRDIHARYDDEPVGCTNWCACGRTAWPSCSCIACPCSSSCICGCKTADSQGKRACKDPSKITCVNGAVSVRIDPCSYGCSCPSSCIYGCYNDGDCLPNPDAPGGGADDKDCTGFDCDDGYAPLWDSTVNSCICKKNPTNPSSGEECPVYTCSDGQCCPSGTYCGTSTLGTICVQQGGGDTPVDNPPNDPPPGCTEPNTDCNPIDYCQQNGFITTPTDYLLEDVVTCLARINCMNVTRRGDCYEDPNIGSDPDSQTLRVKMGENISNWIIQRVVTSRAENIFDRIARYISNLPY